MKQMLRLLVGVFAIALNAASQSPVRPPVSAPAPQSPQVQMMKDQNASAPPPIVPAAPGIIAPTTPQNQQPQNLTVPATPPKYKAAPGVVFGAIFAMMTAVIFLGVGAAGLLLKSDKDWTFADAMSGADGKPSASRLIAFFGFLVIVAIILGVGYSSLWVYLASGELANLSGVSTFLLACAGLFTPYMASQITQSFGSQSSPQSLAPVVMQTANSNLQLSTQNLPMPTFGDPARPPI